MWQLGVEEARLGVLYLFFSRVISIVGVATCEHPQGTNTRHVCGNAFTVFTSAISCTHTCTEILTSPK